MLAVFLKAGLLLPADLGMALRLSNLAGVAGAAGVAGVLGVLAQLLPGAGASGTALIEVCDALKKCMSSFTPMELLYLNAEQCLTNKKGQCCTFQNKK